MTFDDLVTNARREGVLVAQASARVGSALRLGNENERWNVDLSVPRFEWREGEALLFGGTCQLLGTFVEGDGFLWGFENPSVDAAGWQTAKLAMQQLPEVAGALSTRAFQAERDDVQLVCSWLAVKLGFTGCFVGTVGNAEAFLAVGLSEGSGASGWCCFCSALRHQRRALIAASDGVMLCDQCGATCADIAAERGASDATPVDTSAAPTLRFCVFCLEPRAGLILGPHAGICGECATLVGDVLTQKGLR